MSRDAEIKLWKSARRTINELREFCALLRLCPDLATQRDAAALVNDAINTVHVYIDRIAGKGN
jgi:hypothetical protein